MSTSLYFLGTVSGIVGTIFTYRTGVLVGKRRQHRSLVNPQEYREYRRCRCICDHGINQHNPEDPLRPCLAMELHEINDVEVRIKCDCLQYVGPPLPSDELANIFGLLPGITPPVLMPPQNKDTA